MEKGFDLWLDGWVNIQKLELKNTNGKLLTVQD